LRQANDAEIADVRKVGDNDYEITGRRVAGAGMAPSMPAPPAAPAADAEPSSAEPREAEPVRETPAAAAARENGQRFGVRFRRGSRGGLRTSEFPLIGVVQIDAPAEAEPAGADVAIVPEATEEAGAKPARPRRAPRKKKAATSAKAAKAAKSEAPVEPAEAAAEPAVKRTRTRARKKAE
jgi:ribonuclease E